MGKSKARKKEARKIKDKAAMKAGIKKLAAKAKAKSAAKKAAKKTKKLMKKAAKGKKKKKKKKFVQKAKVIGGNIIKGKKLQTLAAAHLVVTTHNTPMHAVPKVKANVNAATAKAIAHHKLGPYIRKIEHKAAHPTVHVSKVKAAVKAVRAIYGAKTKKRVQKATSKVKKAKAKAKASFFRWRSAKKMKKKAKK